MKNIIKNETWVFIPARSGSKSIKNKNIIKLKNKPLIYYTIKDALKLKKITKISKIIFSSDSKKYLIIAKKYGIKDLHLREKKYAQDNSSDLDVFKSYVTNLIKKKINLPEFFIHLRPTTPIRKISVLKKAIYFFNSKKLFYSSMRSVSLMSNTAFKTFRIIDYKLCGLCKKDYDLDKYNLPRQLFQKTYMPNGYIDIVKTKNILNNIFHGAKVLPYLIFGNVIDIDSKNDYNSINK
jgi:CMP-N-acetylneuraminic acid synthetase